MSAPQGRPEPGEYAPYAAEDIACVQGDDIVAALDALGERGAALFGSIGEAHASTYAYAPGKWTLKQILGHLIDDERIFVYRMLCVARGDPNPLPGFDENDYVRLGHFEARSMADLLAEYRATRAATLAFLRGLSPQAWLRRGTVNGYEATVRGLAFHVAGHELHHHRVMAARYAVD
ncbi:MAG TPA: DinB family protein [Holophagaceae bacterium]|nr:DinB family protein [Holophagaceae bacterium]